jgi:hypothetical protein
MQRNKVVRELTLVEGREPNQYMAQELIRTAETMGWKAKLVKTISGDTIISSKLSEIFSDFVVWRGLANEGLNQYEIERILYWLNHSGKTTINTHPEGGRLCTSGKFFQHECFLADEKVREHMLPMYSAISYENVDKLIKDGKINYPFVFKPDFGTRGEGIVLIRNEEELKAFRGNYPAFSVEPYVKSTYDWRVFVLGGAALAAMRKVGDESKEDNFMAKSGGRQRWAEKDVDVNEEIYDLAVRVTAASGLEYAGVDLIRDDGTGRFIVLETNIAGGWQNGFLEATGVHVPTKIMQWLEQRAELKSGNVRGSVQEYIKVRRGVLSRSGLSEFDKIVAFKKESKRDREICNFDIDSRDMPLIRKLSSAYALVQNYELTEVEKTKLKMLIAEVEKYEISRFGNFVGKDSGSLEQSLIPTAYYLAISSKL